MNIDRRKFIGATGVAVAVVLLPSVGAAHSTVAPYHPPFTMREYAWLAYIRKILAQGLNVMYVTSTQVKANKVYHYLNRAPNLYCSTIGASICGRGADMIIMDEYEDYSHHSSTAMRARFEGWFNNTIRTRLYRNGRIEWMQS